MSADDPTVSPAGRKAQHWGCSVDGCDKPHRAQGYCNMHYKRWQRNGAPELTQRRPPRGRPRSVCTVDDCDRPHYALGYCNPHYMRCRLRGDPASDRPLKGFRLDPAYIPDYNAMHLQLRTTLGSASTHVCRDCSGQAAQWSYDNSDPDELVDPATGCRYSTDMARYAPRCIPCHRRVDQAHKKMTRGGSLYDQTAERYREMVRSGELAVGNAVPSARQIATRWDISRATAERALALLRTGGWIRSQSGKPSVVAGNPEMLDQAAS